jgi:hypothetical protein
LVLALAGLTARTANAKPTPPSLEFDSPPRYAAQVDRMRGLASERMVTLMELIGLTESGAPITIVLAPEDHLLARGVPRPISGYAVADRDLAVLLPERVPGYPHDSLDEVLMHELTHLFAARATGGRRMPRWWNEGIALHASRAWSFEDRSRVLLGAVSGVTDVATLERAFERGDQQSAAAYAISGALVQHLVRRYGTSIVAETLERVGEGDDFETAFAVATNVPLSSAVDAFWSRYLFWYRWLPFITSGTALWASITLLAILAGLNRRRRDAEMRRRWEAEERAELQRADAGEIVN